MAANPNPHPEPRRLRRVCLPGAALPAVLAALWLLLPAIALGQQPPAGGDDLLSGFDQPLPGNPAQPPGEEQDLLQQFPDVPRPGTPQAAEGEPEKRIWDLTGSGRLDAAYNYAHDEPAAGETDYRGLSKLRATLRLELKFDFSSSWRGVLSGQAFHDFAYAMRGWDEEQPAWADAYEQEAEVWEAYVQGKLSKTLDLKVGRQIVVWGKADVLRVTDVLNPIDNREPGLVDIEDVRLPVGMTRLDWFFGSWRLTGVAVHEIRFNKDPVQGSDFYPLPFTLPEVVPSDGGANTEYGLALSGVFTGWDAAFYAARVFDDFAHPAAPEGLNPPILCLASLPPTCERHHAKLNMVGAALSVASGNWLWKSELAWFEHIGTLGLAERNLRRTDLMLGFEFAGISDTTLALEAVRRHMIDFDPVLLDPPDELLEDLVEYALIYRADLMRQTLHLAAVGLFFGEQGDNGNALRVSATYDWVEAVALTAGVIAYTGGETNALLTAAEKNDRLFLGAKVSF